MLVKQGLDKGSVLNNPEKFRGEVIAIGEVLWDILPDKKVVGGAPANFALRVQQGGSSAAVISRVGSDSLGDELKEALINLGLKTDLIQTDLSRPTGTVEVTLTEEGNPHFEIVKDVAYDNLEVTPDAVAAVELSEITYFGTLIQRTSKARQAVLSLLEKSKIRFLDINLRANCYTEDTLRSSLGITSILKLNRSEVRELSKIFSIPDTIERFSQNMFQNYPIELILVTLGESGSIAVSKDGVKIETPGYPVEVVDTIGAGDAFAGGFISQFVQKRSLEDCLVFANRFGALAAATAGGMGEFPSINFD
jgi:fructokinase